MRNRDRYLLKLIKSDLKKKMVFIGGPRQVGKTTLAQSLLTEESTAYFNWDPDLDQIKIKNREWEKNEPLIVFDEIHKFKKWRNFMKGLYDTLKKSHSFLVTGSARLDHFRKGGDSLLGRYFYYRLHPFSLPELNSADPENAENLKKLFKFGGFPEPLFEQDEKTLRRWHQARLKRLVKTDLRDLENIQDLDKVELLAEELVRRIGSPLPMRSLGEDLSVDPKTIKRWIDILDSLYYCFQIAPFGSPQIRAVKKEKKLYLWDWSQIEEEGYRFENMMASHLLKFCHYLEDTEGHKMELRYLRDTDKREVDFVVLQKGKPLFAVECKLKDSNPSAALHYFQTRTKIPKFYQVTLEGGERQVNDSLMVTNFAAFCRYEKMI